MQNVGNLVEKLFDSVDKFVQNKIETKTENLVDNLKKLVATERKITAEIISLIQKIDQQKIYLKMGYSSLFSFLTENIGYTPSAAQRRIEASRLIASVPEVKEDLKSGELNLSQVAMVAQVVRQKQKEDPSILIQTEDKKVLLESIKGMDLEKSQVILSQALDLEVKQLEKKKTQADESVRLEITLSKEQVKLLTQVKSLMSHVNPNPSTAEVFEYLAVQYLKKKMPTTSLTQTVPELHPNTSMNMTNPKLKSQTSACMPRSASPTSTSVPVVSARQITKSKSISAKTKKIVWTRDQGKCQYKEFSTGKLCGSQHLLEYDHIKRVRHGGDDHPNNLRLLCKPHNLWRS